MGEIKINANNIKLSVQKSKNLLEKNKNVKTQTHHCKKTNISVFAKVEKISNGMIDHLHQFNDKTKGIVTNLDSLATAFEMFDLKKAKSFTGRK